MDSVTQRVAKICGKGLQKYFGRQASKKMQKEYNSEFIDRTNWKRLYLLIKGFPIP